MPATTSPEDDENVNPFDGLDLPKSPIPPKKKNKRVKSTGSDIDLTEDQKKQILEAPEDVDLMDLTRTIFGNKTLDGRSREGRAVREFRLQNNLEYQTRNRANEVNQIELSVSQKEFIEKQVRNGSKPFQVAKMIFEEDPTLNIKVKPLSREHRAVETYVKTAMPEFADPTQKLATDAYKPPSTFKQILNKINEITRMGIDEEKLDTRTKKSIESALNFAQAKRFVIYANSLQYEQERDLLETEFIGTIWDKPDLTRDELNICFNLCQEYIKQYKIDRYISKLEELMEMLTDDNDGKMAMAIIENIKNHRLEHKQSVALQRQIIKDIGDTRANRLKARRESNRSISQFVEFVQEEDNRELLRKNAELRNKLLDKTMEDYMSTSELIVNIYGVESEDITEWKS